MKKFLYLFVASVFLVLSCGLTTYTHYCKGIQKGGIQLSAVDSEKSCPFCNKLQTEKESSCCELDTQWSKISDQVQKSPVQQLELKVWTAVLTVGIRIENYLKPPHFKPWVSPYFSHLLPPLKPEALYVLHCVYRI